MVMSEAAGQYNKLVDIEQRDTTTTNAAGQVIGGWTLHKQKWAKIRTQNGMTVINNPNGIQGNVVNISVRVRFDTTIDTAMRVNLKGRIFSIEKVVHDEDRSEWTDLVCKAGANEG